MGPLRSMSIFILNVPFDNEKCISVSACSSKMNRRFVCQKAMRYKEDLTTYNASIYLRTECCSVKRDAVKTNKNPRIQIWLIICAATLLRIATCAGRLRYANLMAQRWSHRNLITRKYIDAPKFYAWLGDTVRTRKLKKVLVFWLGYAQLSLQRKLGCLFVFIFASCTLLAHFFNVGPQK